MDEFREPDRHAEPKPSADGTEQAAPRDNEEPGGFAEQGLDFTPKSQNRNESTEPQPPEPPKPRRGGVWDTAGLRSAREFLRRLFHPDSVSGLSLTLLLITVAVGLALSFVYRLAAPIIREREQAALEEAMGVVLAADRYVPLDDTGMFYAAETDGRTMGYIVQVSPVGYGGNLQMLVGVNTDMTVVRAVIVSHSETKEIGDRAVTEEWFLEQFIGKTLPLSFGDGVDAISGATVTSRAVLTGLTDALRRALDYVQGGDAP